jgi:hypothetical protein
LVGGLGLLGVLRLGLLKGVLDGSGLGTLGEMGLLVRQGLRLLKVLSHELFERL